MDKLRQAAWTAIHKINRSTGFDEESDVLLMEAASVLREALRPEVAPDGRVAKTVFTLDDMTKAFEEGRKNGRTEALAEQEKPLYRKVLREMLDAHEQAEQEPFDMDDHPPHRLCECSKCMEYFTPLPDCDAFAASGKPIAEQTNTQLMEGYRIGLAEMREKCAKVVESGVLGHGECAAAIRAIKFEGDTGFRPVSEMIAEHKQDPKKAAAIEKAKMRKADQKPVAEVVLHSHKVGFGRTEERKDIMFLADVEVGTKLYAAPVQQAEQEQVAWHHPECDGQCIACLIEKAVQDAYGTQGRDYMLRHINAAPVRQIDLSEDDLYELQDSNFKLQIICSFDEFKQIARAVTDKLREKENQNG